MLYYGCLVRFLFQVFPDEVIRKYYQISPYWCVLNKWFRVRKLTKMTEKLSKSMLDMVGVASGSVMGPVMKSQAGRAFFAMVPGQVLLASLDAVSKYFNFPPLLFQR